MTEGLAAGRLSTAAGPAGASGSAALRESPQGLPCDVTEGPGTGLVATSSPAVAVRVLHRRDVGSCVHVFSHVLQTNYVERLTVQVDGFAALQAAAEAVASGSSGGSGELLPGTAMVADGGAEEGGQSKAAVAAAGKAGTGGEKPGKAGALGTKGKGKGKGAVGGGSVAVRPLLKWVRQSDMATIGLSTGVRKILKLAGLE